MKHFVQTDIFAKNKLTVPFRYLFLRSMKASLKNVEVTRFRRLMSVAFGLLPSLRSFPFRLLSFSGIFAIHFFSLDRKSVVVLFHVQSSVYFIPYACTQTKQKPSFLPVRNKAIIISCLNKHFLYLLIH